MALQEARVQISCENSRPRIGIVGAGVIGARHARLVAAEGFCELGAIADPTPDGEALAAELDAPWMRDGAALAEAGTCDGVIVATPTPDHVETALRYIERGVPVLVEKPIADTVAAGRRLLDAATEANVCVLTGHHRRFDPSVRLAQDLMGEGGIGQLLAVNAIWAVRKPESYYDVAWRRSPGGGPVLINLIHDIDMLRALCGEIESVQALCSHAARGFAVEDTAAILLRFRGGAVGTVTMSDAAPSPWGWEQATGENPLVPATAENPYRLFGTAGSLEFPRIKLWRHADPASGGWSDPLQVREIEAGPRTALLTQLRHFCDVIRADALPMVSAADGLATLAATEAVLHAARDGRAITPQFVLPAR